MTAIDVGCDPDGSGSQSIGTWNSGGVVSLISLYNTVNMSGEIEEIEIGYINDSDYNLSATVSFYSVTDAGSGSYYLNVRSSAVGITFDANTSGKKTISSLSLGVHDGDCIGIRVTCPVDNEATFSLYTSDSPTSDNWCIVFDDFTNGTVSADSGTSYPLKLYATGTAYPVNGGVGGTVRNACQTVSETIEEDESSAGLWGVVTPRSFGLSGGNDAAYVDLTFPWDTEGTYTEDEIFVDGTTKSFTNDNNPLEKYTLKMDVSRFTGDDVIVDDLDMSEGSAQYDTFVHWTKAGTVGYYSRPPYARLVRNHLTVGAVSSLSQDVQVKSTSGTFTFQFGATHLAGSDVLHFGCYLEIYIGSTRIYQHDLVPGDDENVTGVTASYSGIPVGTHTLKVQVICHTYYDNETAYVKFMFNSVTSNYSTGACSNFYECWYITTDDRYVKKDGDDNKLGISWDTAYATYQKGKDELGDGGTLHVRAGSYTTTDSNVFPAKSCIVKPYVDETQSPSNQIIITKS